MARLSLALSGSGFKFPAHVGAIQAVMESGHELIEVSGTSGGSIIASMWACGLTIDQMNKVALYQNWKPYIRFQLKALFQGGINTGNLVKEFAEELTFGLSFEDLDRPITIASTDLITNEPFIFNHRLTPEAKLSDAIRASVSIPVLFAPHRYGNMLLADGVVSNSLPVNHLLQEDSSKIGVKIMNTGPEYPEISTKSGPIKVAKRALYHMVDRQDDWVFETGHFGDLIRIHTSYCKGLDPNMSLSVRQKLMKDGYMRMREHLKEIFPSGHRSYF